MEEESLIQEEEPIHKSGGDTGMDFVKKIRPIGIVFFLGLFVVFMLICFSSGLEPVKDYKVPHDSEYYAQNSDTLEELRAELEENFFPYIDGVTGSGVSNGKLTISTTDSEFIKVRSAVLRYYDKDLFDFEKGGTMPVDND